MRSRIPVIHVSKDILSATKRFVSNSICRSREAITESSSLRIRAGLMICPRPFVYRRCSLSQFHCIAYFFGFVDGFVAGFSIGFAFRIPLNSGLQSLSHSRIALLISLFVTFESLSGLTPGFFFGAFFAGLGSRDMNLRIFVVLILRRFLFYRLLLRLRLCGCGFVGCCPSLGILLFVLVFFLILRATIIFFHCRKLCLLQQVSLKLAVLCREVNRPTPASFVT